MASIAVVGTGSIGALMGSYLSRAYRDVTMVSIHRRGQADDLRRQGLTMEGYGETFHVDVRAQYLPEVPADETWDLILLTMKSNALEESLPEIRKHLRPDGLVIQTQNGINDELITRYIPAGQLLTAVLFCGGAQLSPGHFMNHDGFIYLGAMEAGDPARVERAAEILGQVRKVIVTEDIRNFQWDKLARVCLSVPTATVSGLYLGAVFKHPETQKLFALLALELFAVARADAHPRQTVEERTEETWRKIRDGELTGLEGRENEPDWPDGIRDAYTHDMEKKQPLEIWYTNGAIVRMGKKYGVPTPVNDMLLDTIGKIEKGEAKPGIALMKSVIAANLQERMDAQP